MKNILKIFTLLLLSTSCFSQTYTVLDTATASFKIDNAVYPKNSVILGIRPDTNYVQILSAYDFSVLIRAKRITYFINGVTNDTFSNRTELQEFYYQYMLKDTSSTFVTASGVATLTNKRFTQRTNSDSSSYYLKININSDNYDNYDISAQATALLFNSDSGTPTCNQTIEFYIKDNGVARALTYDSKFNWTPPTTTTAGKGMRMQFKWNCATSKWNFTGSKVEP